MFRICHAIAPWVIVVVPTLGWTVGARADEHPDLAPSHSVKPELYATGFEFA